MKGRWQTHHCIDSDIHSENKHTNQNKQIPTKYRKNGSQVTLPFFPHQRFYRTTVLHRLRRLKDHETQTTCTTDQLHYVVHTQVFTSPCCRPAHELKSQGTRYGSKSTTLEQLDQIGFALAITFDQCYSFPRRSIVTFLANHAEGLPAKQTTSTEGDLSLFPR